jgi:ferredoxin-NADP reductase
MHQRLENVVAGMAAGTILSFAAATLGQPPASTGAPTQHGQPSLSLTTGGLALGGLVGLLSPALLSSGLLSASRRRQQVRGLPASDAAGEPWTGWREFRVNRKHPESAEITSFELEPVDGGNLPGFLPGQFLTLELTIPGQAKPVLRTYSLSDYPAAGKPIRQYRLSIKREPAPKDLNVPPGLASNFLHDHVAEGSTLRIRPPAGSFVLDTSSTKAIVLISNGVGITPMIAMAKAALQQPSPRPIWFLHGCRNGAFHAFRQEITELAAAHPHLHLHIAYSRPSPEDAGHFQSEGYVDGALVRSLVNQDADYFLCGSPPFMQGLIAELQGAGIAESAIHFEMFSREPRSTAQASAESSSSETTSTETSSSLTATITFARSGQSATWASSDPDDTLLAFAEAQGLEPAFSCRAGVCGTCACRVIEGEVHYISEPSAAVAQGSALICIARPKGSSLSLEL